MSRRRGRLVRCCAWLMLRLHRRPTLAGHLLVVAIANAAPRSALD